MAERKVVTVAICENGHIYKTLEALPEECVECFAPFVKTETVRVWRRD